MGDSNILKVAMDFYHSLDLGACGPYPHVGCNGGIISPLL
jgi:hypothetical protein